MSPDDKQDLVSSVTETLWLRRTDADAPDSLRRLLGLARTILTGKLIDHWRHEDVVEEHVVPASHALPRDPDGDDGDDDPNDVDELGLPRCVTPESALATKEQLLFADEEAPAIGMTDDDVETMWALTYDREATYRELADERGTTEGALRTREHRLRKTLNVGWVRRSVILTLLLFTLLLLALAAIGVGRRPPPPDPLPPPPTVREVAPPPAPAPEPERVEETPPGKFGKR
jgi:DNA-directed RNA polymerase specialized sigma24 family protein